MLESYHGARGGGSVQNAAAEIRLRTSGIIKTRYSPLTYSERLVPGPSFTMAGPPSAMGPFSLTKPPVM